MKKRQRLSGLCAFLCTAVLLLAACGGQSSTQTAVEEPAPTVSPLQTSAPTVSPLQTSAPTAAPTLTPSSAPTPIPDSVPTPDPGALLELYRKSGLDAQTEIEDALAVLRARDPAMGELWTDLFEKMYYVNQGVKVSETVPEGLPEDDSLCIVVFGYCLHPDGSMPGELVGRCAAALACAQAYPQAYIALTGGPTASDELHMTEAGVMSRYFMAHGVAKERLILERRSHSTAENAINLHAILTEQYPQIKSLVIVSSSYHVPLCGLLMEETALIEAYEKGSASYEVVAGLGFPVENHGDYESPAVLADYVRIVAEKKLNG